MRHVDAVEHALAPDALSVRAARREVARFFAGVLGGRQLEGLLLATSEVVTNAVEHGSPPIALIIERTDDRARVEVHDGSPLRPRAGQPLPTDVRGRGMVIVDQCADRWGVETEAHGKAVWIEVDVHHPGR